MPEVTTTTLPPNATIPADSLLTEPPYRARFKYRYPDPGECVVLAINWESKRITMNNGAFTYSASFDEVNIYLAKAV